MSILSSPTDDRKEPYVLQSGKHAAFDSKENRRRLFRAGEVVELTRRAYLAFKDKFKPLGQVKAEAELAARQVELAREFEEEQKRIEATRKKFDQAVAAGEASTQVESPTPVQAASNTDAPKPASGETPQESKTPQVPAKPSTK